MIKFDLEGALAGDKVITRDGQEVTQFKVFSTSSGEDLACVIDGSVRLYDGLSGLAKIADNIDLFMAPKNLSGFVNIYDNDSCTYSVHSDRRTADKLAGSKRTACINLSQFEEGYGL